jgi:hypothetical protein
MAAISSSVGLQSVAQAAFQQLKFRQAEQNAERAEQVARNLRDEATQAQREADRAQENARTLSVRSQRAQSVAGQARQGLAMIRTVGEMQEGLSGILARVGNPSGGTADSGAKSADGAVVTTGSAPVINTSGQTTGVVVNTTA